MTENFHKCSGLFIFMTKMAQVRGKKCKVSQANYSMQVAEMLDSVPMAAT